MRKKMRKIKFGRFEYNANFAYYGRSNIPMFGWLTEDDKVFNCAENSDGDSICGKIEFSNIDAKTVRESIGECYNSGPMLINWWDCRKSANIASCIA